MAAGINRLSPKRIATLKDHGRHADGGGLYLVVDQHGKRWVYMWTRAGRRTEMGLGPLRDVSLAEARELAAQARAALRRGLDPRQARARTVPTFGECADAYVTSMAPQFKNAKHLWQWRQTLGDAYCRAIRSKPVDQISTEDVLGVLSPIWLSKNETAARLRGRIERVLDAARAKGLRSGENPARWRGHLDHLLPRRQKLQRGHHRAIPASDVPALIARLREIDTMAAACLEWCILTACRTGEAIGARWEEIDGDLWTIPAARMKAKRPHRVPLTPRCLALLDELRQVGSPWVFPGQRRGRPLSNMAMLELLRKMGVDATTHGFRSTFRDWAGDNTSFPREIIEAALAHTVGSETERAYRRGDALERRRDLMAAWASACEPAPASNVVRLRG
jgi:integrase